ncbi:MAG: PH domain-containing protein [Ilumatobacter sp.]
MTALREPKRQSPWAIAFLGWRIVRSIGGVQAAIALFFVFTRGIGSWLLIVLPVLAVAIGIAAGLSWWRFTFQLVDDEFIVRSGVLRIDRLSVPIARVQSVSTQQDLLHRLVGVVRISLDTAGSEETEFRLDAVDRSIADEMQRAVGRVRPHQVDSSASGPAHIGADTSTEPSARTLLAHSPGRLAIAAVTSWPWAGLVVLAPLFAARDQVGDDLPVPEVDLERAQWWWVAPGIGIVVTVAVVLNVVQLLLRNWNLRVEADDTNVRRSAGLVSKRRDARDASRVQVVSTAANPLQRAVGLSTVGLSVSGDGDLEVIGCDADEIARLSAAVDHETVTALAPARRIERAEIWLATRNTSLLAAVIAAATAVLFGWWALLAFAIVPVTWFRRWRHVRNFRWDVTDTELVAVGRIIDDWSEQSLLRSTNGVSVRRSFYERRRSLASVDVETAAGTITIGMLSIDEANAVRDHVLASVLLDDRPWM